MDPAEIDWKNIASRYELDEVYERINAPKWLDFSAPDAAIDDGSWFCRPDCRHPITYEDFERWNPGSKEKAVRSNSEAVPGNEQNSNQRNADLKRRGGIVSFLPSKPKFKSGKVREDFENHNPNVEASPLMMKGKKMAVAGKKEAIKSSAEKKGAVIEEDMKETQSKRSQPQPRLKSTFSARILFSGKDILSQISDFCYELKKLATGKDSTAINEEEKKVNVEVLEEESMPVLKDKMEEKKTLISTIKTGSLKKRCELAVKFDSNSEEKKNNILKEARAYPPTPQRFPSLSSHHRQLKGSKASANSSSSPALSKIPKSKTPQERGVLQELNQRRGEENIELIPNNEECGRASVVSGAEEESTVDVFWFLKPCTYLS